jgi:hypothetical protein
MPRQILEDLAFSYFYEVLRLHVQGEPNFVPSYFIFVCRLLAITRYYEKFPLEDDGSLIKLKERMEKAMELVKKDQTTSYLGILQKAKKFPTFGFSDV